MHSQIGAVIPWGILQIYRFSRRNKTKKLAIKLQLTSDQIHLYVTAFGFLLWHVFPQVQRHPGSQGLEPINKWFICYNLNCYREDNNILNLKVNHSFEPNSEFILFSAHPVLGTVMALAAMEDMVAGQELTVNYGYVGNCRQ